MNWKYIGWLVRPGMSRSSTALAARLEHRSFTGVSTPNDGDVAAMAKLVEVCGISGRGPAFGSSPGEKASGSLALSAAFGLAGPKLIPEPAFDRLVAREFAPEASSA